ncbi:MAG TPA: dipeptidase [Holophaga sp.]|nr:dipeptidase [Holophaga sp.]
MSQPTATDTLLAQARELHQTMFTVDTHCDTPGMLTLKGWDLGTRHEACTLLGGDLDLVRMKEGGLASAFLAVYVGQGPRTPEGYAQARRKADGLLDALDASFLRHSDLCEPARSPKEARRIHGQGKRAIFIGMENGYPLGQDLDLLDGFHRRGVRYLTLCHASDNDLCAACTSMSGATMRSRGSDDSGLTEFGARVVRRMNALGMIVDVSHTSERTVQDVLAVSKVPVIASHSGARSVSDHPRNLSDSQLRAIAAGGGVVQVYFVPFFLNPGSVDPAGDKVADALWSRMHAHYAEHAIGEDPAVDAGFERDYRTLLADFPPAKVSVKDVADHIDHVARVAGIDHVGIGSDFDGGGRLADCRDVSEVPNLTAELLRRGYSETDIRKIWGENLLRVFDQVLAGAD